MSYKYILFTERLHKALISEGYHAVRTKDKHLPQKGCRAQKQPEGCILQIERYKNQDENGNWVYKYDETEVIFYNYYSTDPDNPRTREFYNRYPMMKPKDTEGLLGAARRKAEIHNQVRHASIDSVPDANNATEIEVEFPLTNQMVSAMYPTRSTKFYVRINVGYNKGNFRKINYHLYKKLLPSSGKNLRLLGGR